MANSIEINLAKAICIDFCGWLYQNTQTIEIDKRKLIENGEEMSVSQLFDYYIFSRTIEANNKIQNK